MFVNDEHSPFNLHFLLLYFIVAFSDSNSNYRHLLDKDYTELSYASHTLYGFSALLFGQAFIYPLPPPPPPKVRQVANI